MNKYLVVKVDGTLDSHIAGAVSDFATLCGMDGDDIGVDQQSVGKAPQVTCKQCIAIWHVAHTVPRRDLVE